MDNQVDFINLAPKVGPEAIAAGAAQFSAGLAQTSVKIGEQFAEKEKARQKALADALKEQNKTRADIQKANEKIIRDGKQGLIEAGQDTKDFELESRRLGELANEAQFILTPPYSEGYSREDRQKAQKQVDEFFSYINTSKAAGGKVEAAVNNANQTTKAGGVIDQTNGYTLNVKDLIPGGITDQESYVKNNTYNGIVHNYFTNGRVLPKGWEVTASNKSVEGQSTSSYVFNGPDGATFSLSIDGSNSPLEFADSIGEPTSFEATKTIKDEGLIVDRFKYSVPTASVETLNDGLERINEIQFINMQAVETEFKDQVRGNIQGAFLEGKLGLLNYLNYNVGKKDPQEGELEGTLFVSLEDAIAIYDSEELSEKEKINQLTNLVSAPLLEKFKTKYNAREASAEEIQQAKKNGVNLTKNEKGVPLVYSEIDYGASKRKPKEDDDNEDDVITFIKDAWLKSGREIATNNRAFVGIPVDANGNEILNESTTPAGYRLMKSGMKEGTTMLMPVSSTDKIYKNVDEFLQAIGKAKKYVGLNVN